MKLCIHHQMDHKHLLCEFKVLCLLLRKLISTSKAKERVLNFSGIELDILMSGHKDQKAQLS